MGPTGNRKLKLSSASLSTKPLKVAIIHDWLVVYAGAERVLEQMLTVFPQADLFATVNFLPKGERQFIGNRPVNTSFIQRFPLAKRFYRQYLPLMPLAVEQFDLSSYDLVISSSASVAKGVITGPDQLHICMCYSPMRYAWDLTHQYLKESGLTSGPKSWIARYLLHRLRKWDRGTANGVDEFIAISHFIERRIHKVYRRESKVIYPPVDTNAFALGSSREDYYVTSSRMVPYKRIDLIVEAFTQMPERKLMVIGDGPEMAKIRRKAGPNIQLLGYLAHDVLKRYLQSAKAFVFAAEEDFGIAPIEAMACGTPVIAYGRGAARETITPGVSGILFHDQTAEAIVKAVIEFEESSFQFDPARIRRSAMRFSSGRFRDEFSQFVKTAISRQKDRVSSPNFESTLISASRPDRIGKRESVSV